jgi:hypothetical protein
VEQPVVTPARTGGHLAAFDDGDAKAAEGEIVSQAATGGAPADDQYMRVMSRMHLPYQ